MLEDQQRTGSLEERVVALRSRIDGTSGKIFDDPRMTSVRIKKILPEIQNELPNLLQSYSQLRNSQLREIEVRRPPRHIRIQLEIDLHFQSTNKVEMSLSEKVSSLRVHIEKSNGFEFTLEDDLGTPIAECLRLQLIQETLDYILKCRDLDVTDHSG